MTDILENIKSIHDFPCLSREPSKKKNSRLEKLTRKTFKDSSEDPTLYFLELSSDSYLASPTLKSRQPSAMGADVEDNSEYSTEEETSTCTPNEDYITEEEPQDNRKLRSYKIKIPETFEESITEISSEVSSTN
jgi:hypothetical protein